MAWFRGLLPRLRVRRRRILDPVTFEFPRLNIDYVLERLAIRELARTNGSHDIPATSDTELDGPHQRIVQHVSGEIVETTAQCGTILLGLNQRIAGLDVTNEIRKLRNLPDEFRDRLFSLLQEGRAALQRAQSAFEHVEEELRAFKTTHGMTREARYPESYFFHITMLAALVLAEAALNTYFFALGSPEGYVGGAIQATVLAAVDIVCVSVLGRWVSFVTSRRLHTKLFGFFWAPVCAAWIVIYNLVVAHYRDQLSVSPDEATSLVLKSFVDSPFGLQDLNSWILFALGLVFSTGAAIDGFTWDDPYPGYGKLHRRHRRAHDEFAYRNNTLTGEAARLRDHFLEQAEIVAQHVRDEHNALENAVDTKATLLNNVREFIDHYEGSCNALIQTYRDLNRQHRSTDPPAYFQEKWSYPTPKEFLVEIEQDRSKLRQQAELAKSLTQAKQTTRRAINSRFEDECRGEGKE